MLVAPCADNLRRVRWVSGFGSPGCRLMGVSGVRVPGISDTPSSGCICEGLWVSCTPLLDNILAGSGMGRDQPACQFGDGLGERLCAHGTLRSFVHITAPGQCFPCCDFSSDGAAHTRPKCAHAGTGREAGSVSHRDWLTFQRHRISTPLPVSCSPCLDCRHSIRFETPTSGLRVHRQPTSSNPIKLGGSKHARCSFRAQPPASAVLPTPNAPPSICVLRTRWHIVCACSSSKRLPSTAFALSTPHFLTSLSEALWPNRCDLVSSRIIVKQPCKHM